MYIERNESFTGNGAQFFIHNRPENAKVFHILKVHDGVTEEMDWVSTTDFYSERFFSDIYTYEFLNAGEQYEIIFEYRTEDSHKSQTVDKVVVPVVPKRGRDVVIEKNKMSLSVDEETGEIKWINPPVVRNLPDGARLSFYVQSYDDTEWAWVGYFDCSPYEIKTYNIYEDFKGLNVDNVLSGKIYIEVFYKYKSCRWRVMNTSLFKFDKEKYLQGR